LLPLLSAIGLTALRRCRYTWRAIVFTAVGGCLVAAFFLGPLIDERQYVQLDNALRPDYTQIAEVSTPLKKLISSPAAYDANLGNNAIGEHMGSLCPTILAMGLVFGVATWRRRPLLGAVAAVLGALGLTVLWLQTPSSDWLWRAVTILGYVQIRSRLLALVALSASIVAGILVKALPPNARRCVGSLAPTIMVLVAVPVLYPTLQHHYNSFTQNPTVQDVQSFAARREVPGLTAYNEFLPRWRTLPISADATDGETGIQLASAPKGTRVSEAKVSSARISQVIDTPDMFDATMRILYYPGWEARIDGEPRTLEPQRDTGYIVIPKIPAGEHTLVLEYVGTGAQRFGALASGIACAGLVLLAMLWRGDSGADPTPEAVTGFSSEANWLPVLCLICLFLLKVMWIDPGTLQFRENGTCSIRVNGAVGVDVGFGQDIRLCATVLPTDRWRAGSTAQIVLYWQVQAPPEKNPHAFVHLMGTAFNPSTGNPLWGQQDKAQPANIPIGDWEPGKLYRDEYQFRIPTNAPPGLYQLEIGWWSPTSGQRLSPTVFRGDDLVVSHLDSVLTESLPLESTITDHGMP
jgi:hypothetical protein